MTYLRPSETLKKAQAFIGLAGFRAGGELIPDGYWGECSREAMTAFQQANGLTPTGEFDAATAVFLLTGWGEGVTASEASRFVDHGVFDSGATGLRFAPHFRP